MAALALAAAFAAPALVPALADEEDCPDIGLVPELTRLTKFKDGPGRNVQDIQYDVIVQSTSRPVCREKDRRVFVNLQIAFAVQRAQADPGGRIDFSYFVAIRHRVSGEIVTKEVFPVQVNWPQGRTNAVLEEELEQVTIPIRKDEKPIYYAILVGLQLTEDQLNYNRVRRGETVEPRAAGGPARPALPTLPGLPPAGGATPAPPGAPAPAPARPGLPTLPKQ